jgi:anti-sigma B factor antagonist
MKLTQRHVGDVTVLDLDGRLVLDDGDTLLRDSVSELVRGGRLKIVVNLKRVTYIDSCGVGVLVAKLVSVRNRGGDLRLMHLSPRAQHVLEISKLSEVFESFDREEDALASFAA